MVTSASAMLAREINLGMHHSHVTCQCVIAGKGLLLDAESAAHLLLAGIVDRVLVTGQVVRAREDSVARLARGWVDALTLVGARLRVALKDSRRRHSGAEVCAPMALALVLLQLLRRLKALRAAMICA